LKIADLSVTVIERLFYVDCLVLLLFVIEVYFQKNSTANLSQIIVILKTFIYTMFHP